MKKFGAFIGFLVAIVVVVSLGLTTYYFLRNDEVINFNTKEIYCNVNDVIAISDLGKTVTKENKDTTYNYNAGGEEVTSKILYDEKTGCYRVGDQGGDVTLVITTSNKNCAKFNILVHIGDGSETNPYNISSQEELERIGSQYPLAGTNAHYELRNSFALTNSFKPIGYNFNSNEWIGFAGTFNGNGNTISGLRLNGTDYTNAGLFYSLNNATVSNLRLTGAEIVGAYQNVGILAGSASGLIDRVEVSGNILNTQANSKNGGLVGSIVGGASVVKLAGANGSLTLGSAIATADETDTPVAEPVNMIAGGLIGEINEAKVQATYANVKINVNNVTGNIGGFAGKLVVTADNGTVRQSYSVSTSEYANFANFIDVVEKSGNFPENHNYLKYLVGNYAKTAEGQKVINTCDEAIYTEFNDTLSNYYVVGLNDLTTTTEFVFYATSRDNKTLWDRNAWAIEFGKLPALRFTDTELSGISNEYFTKDLEEQQVANSNEFIALIKDNAIDSAKITLIKDADETKNVIDLRDETWTPVALNNSVIDFGGYVVKGLDLVNANGDNLGFFSSINNSTVKNLVLEGVKVSADATNVGALAGSVTATDTELGVSSIDNVQVTFDSSVNINQTITNFGGLVGVVDNGTIITNAKVNDIRMSSESTVANVGGLVALLKSGSIENSNVENVVLNGGVVAGVVAENDGNISGVDTVAVTINKATTAAGVTANNRGNILDVNANVTITLGEVATNVNLAGISTTNTGNIQSVTITGSAISVANTSSADAVRMAGLVVDNSGYVEDAQNYIVSVGTLINGKSYEVGGLFVTNSGSATRCIAGSKLYGNTVAGAVVTMTAGNIDQVLIGSINRDTKEISTNEIQGDKFVAGVAYDMQGTATITNVQAESALNGTSNDARVSLVVLRFPDGTVLVNATINSTVSGFGTFYRETWKDYDVNNEHMYYNIYGVNSASGRMQSVVINTERAQSNGTELLRSEFITTTWFATYENNENSSYVKSVSNEDFYSTSTYTSQWTDSAPVWWPVSANFSHDMQFDIGEEGNVWTNMLSTGIRLAFIANA